MNCRDLVWFSAVAIALGACFAYGYICESFSTPSYWRVGLFPVIGAAAVAMVFLTRPIHAFRTCLVWIWIPALLLRLALLPAAPSDDVNRYLWEGRLVASGISPYSHTADDEAWRHLRDEYWRQMNHKDQPTAYPPMTELLFGAVSSVAYHPFAFKVFFIFADLLTLAGVLVLLRQRGMALAYAGFYAFNPLVLISYAAEAHFDALMVAALVWALVAEGAGRSRWAVGLASVATGIKWVVLPLIPFFAGKRLVSGALLALAVWILPALCFWETLPQLWQGLLQYGSTRDFNGPIYEGLRWFGWSRLLCSGLVAGAMAGVVLWRWLVRERASVDSHIRWILGALIVLSPTVHFWYIAWILPFVCLRPSLPWLTFSLTGGAYFFVWTNAAAGVWDLQPWQQVVFWLPFGLACLYELWSTRGRVVWPARRAPAEADGTVAVVIPSLNVAERIGGALESIVAQQVPVAEVILVDAGSSDRTVEIAESFDLPIRILHSERGRGQQIAAGIEAATAEWVIVLHADAALQPESVAQVLAAARTQPDLIGGALGQRFEDAQAILLPIELLNDLRGLFTRTAFGDQAQFFHRATAQAHSLMPKQPLMEDVESSWRLRECGAFIFLNQPTRVCHRKWQAKDWLKRFALVLRLVARYRTARLQSRAAATALSERLYGEYYGPKQ
jgi:hypothetical protein